VAGKSIFWGVTLLLALGWSQACGQELDDILPANIPGYGTQFGVAPPPNRRPPPPAGFLWELYT